MPPVPGGITSTQPAENLDQIIQTIPRDDYIRILKAFNTLRSANMQMHFNQFNRFVLDNSLPTELARTLFDYCTGLGSKSKTDWITFNCLVAGLAVVTNETYRESFIEKCPEFDIWRTHPPSLRIDRADDNLSKRDTFFLDSYWSAEEIAELLQVFDQCREKTLDTLAEAITYESWLKNFDFDFDINTGTFKTFTDRLFKSLDTDNDNRISFSEYVIGLNMLCRAPFAGRLERLIAIWDVDKDKRLNEEELKTMLNELEMPDDALNTLEENPLLCEIAAWACEDATGQRLQPFQKHMIMMDQAACLFLGVKPKDKEQELFIVTNLMARIYEEHLGEPGASPIRNNFIWNVVSSKWYIDYIADLKKNHTQSIASAIPVNNDAIRAVLPLDPIPIEFIKYSTFLFRICELHKDDTEETGGFLTRGLRRMGRALAAAFSNLRCTLTGTINAKAVERQMSQEKLDKKELLKYTALQMYPLEMTFMKMDPRRELYTYVPSVLWRAWRRWRGPVWAGDDFRREMIPIGQRIPELDDKTGNMELYPCEVILLEHDSKLFHLGKTIVRPFGFWQVSRKKTLTELANAVVKMSPVVNDAILETRFYVLSEDSLVRHPSDEEGGRYEVKEKQLVFPNPNLANVTLGELGRRTKQSITEKPISFKFLFEYKTKAYNFWPEDVIELHSARKVGKTPNVAPGEVGLNNSNFQCYRNAAMQLLARVQPLTDHLLHRLKKGDLAVQEPIIQEVMPKSKITYFYADNVLRPMFQKKPNKTLVPYALHASIDTWKPPDHDEVRYPEKSMQDAASFLQDFVNELSKDVSRIPSGRMAENPLLIPQVEIPPDTPEHVVDEMNKSLEFWRNMINHEGNNSLLTQLFAGQHRKLWECVACHQIATTFDTYPTIWQLPIGYPESSVIDITLIDLENESTRYSFTPQIVPGKKTLQYLTQLICSQADIENPNVISLHCITTTGRMLAQTSNSSRKKMDDCLVEQIPRDAKIYAIEEPAKEWVLAIHRRMEYNSEPYMLGATNGNVISRFGIPILLPLTGQTSGAQLRQIILERVVRSQLKKKKGEPVEIPREAPFVLRIVDSNWQWCGKCEPLKFCRGCSIETMKMVSIPKDCGIAIDWAPASLFINYNFAHEDEIEERKAKRHSSARLIEQEFKQTTLQKCIDKVSELTTAEKDCEGCGRNRDWRTTTVVRRASKYMILQLMRYEWTNLRAQKVNRRVSYSLYPDDPLQIKCYRDLYNFDIYQYDVLGIINHYGPSVNSGHYIAYIRRTNPDGSWKWICCNDDSVEVVSVDGISQQDTYVLLLERREEVLVNPPAEVVNTAPVATENIV